MSVEFKVDSKSEKVSLNHKDFEVFYAAFEALRSKTGIRVDEYSDGKISPDHAGILNDFIDEHISLPKASNCISFKELLQYSYNNKLWISYTGD
ncbi:hypothetical protein [Pseudoalteromonas piratica]|uniref:Uncharacterized protein n=1 Tax=Pseudoalteromonas piratica TaxID=1348114 RepID=A0A0A7ELA9_9GAMM|nr:hypothetical protein [Pseudoalteromonas piratica]AIY67424.1 hypothetical protein OM33_20550 [Pseudoalteromonas piratica]